MSGGETKHVVLNAVVVLCALIAGCGVSPRCPSGVDNQATLTESGADGNGNSETGAGIANKADCEAAGGVWQPWGLRQVESCNLRASDAGMPCQDSSECDGACVAPLGPGSECDALTGACSDFQVFFGCACFVEEDSWGGAICVD